MKLSMLPPARAEMLRAARWYDGQGAGLGDRLLDEIRNACVAIQEFPAAGSPVDGIYRRKLLDKFPYSLVYRIDGEDIVIVAVANFKRRPRYWRKRMKGVSS